MADQQPELAAWLAALHNHPLQSMAPHQRATLAPPELQQLLNNIHEPLLHDESRRVPTVGPDGTPPRYSAVLILLGHVPTGDAQPDTLSVLLTHRAPTMRKHSGQMAFPGGGWEAQDSDPIVTALRESEEETGLDPTSVQPLAMLEPLYIDRTNFAVVPVVAYWTQPHEVYAASPENDWVAMVPISELVEPTHRFNVEFGNWIGPAFHVAGMVLWGFTAAVMHGLIQRAGWEQPWGEDDPENTVNLFQALEASANQESTADMRNYYEQ